MNMATRLSTVAAIALLAYQPANAQVIDLDGISGTTTVAFGDNATPTIANNTSQSTGNVEKEIIDTKIGHIIDGQTNQSLEFNENLIEFYAPGNLAEADFSLTGGADINAAAVSNQSSVGTSDLTMNDIWIGAVVEGTTDVEVVVDRFEANDNRIVGHAAGNYAFNRIVGDFDLPDADQDEEDPAEASSTITFDDTGTDPTFSAVTSETTGDVLIANLQRSEGAITADFGGTLTDGETIFIGLQADGATGDVSGENFEVNGNELQMGAYGNNAINIIAGNNDNRPTNSFVINSTQASIGNVTSTVEGVFIGVRTPEATVADSSSPIVQVSNNVISGGAFGNRSISAIALSDE